MSTEALAQLVTRANGIGSEWVSLLSLARMLGWSPQQARTQMSALQETLERSPWYLAPAPSSAGPAVDGEELLTRAQQLIRGYRDGVA